MSPSKHALEPSGAAWRVELWRALALLLALKGAFLLVDPNLRLFMGDSASYLHAALSDWDPPDRSFVYPMLVEWSAVATQSALSLVLLQTLFGVIGALLAYWMLRRAAGVDARIALFAVAVIAVEPAQLFYERMLMAEAAGLLSLLALVAASVAYVQRGRLRWALVMAVCGVLAVAFRMSLLPVVFGLALLVPMLRSWHAAAEQDRGRRVLAALRAGAHAAVILACVLGAHRLYQGLYGLRFDTEPTHMLASGQMRLGLVAPLVKPEHLQRVGLPAELLQTVGPTLQDHRMREAQMWQPDGLWKKLEAELDYRDAQQAARKIAVRALQAEPQALLRMGFATLMDYFDDGLAVARLRDDYGSAPPPLGTLEALASQLRYDARGLAEHPGVVGQMFLGSRWWLTLALFALAPAAVACLWLTRKDPRRRAAACVIGFTALGLVASQLLFSHIVSFRYLHPMPVFLVLCFALTLPPRNARETH